MEEITKEDFMDYVKVQKSGLVNMFMTTTVEELSGLSKEKQMAIMKNYSDYKEMFSDDKKEETQQDMNGRLCEEEVCPDCGHNVDDCDCK